MIFREGNTWDSHAHLTLSKKQVDWVKYLQIPPLHLIDGKYAPDWPMRKLTSNFLILRVNPKALFGDMLDAGLFANKNFEVDNHHGMLRKVWLPFKSFFNGYPYHLQASSYTAFAFLLATALEEVVQRQQYLKYACKIIIHSMSGVYFSMVRGLDPASLLQVSLFSDLSLMVFLRCNDAQSVF